MRQAYRAAVLHCLADPGEGSNPSALEYFEDGLLIVEDGVVQEAGDASSLLPQLADDVSVMEYTGKIIVPGFIDCHVHYPQLDIIASYGEQLLDWLDRYAFPAEAQFAARLSAAVSESMWPASASRAKEPVSRPPTASATI